MTGDERIALNQKHYDLPEVGDYWHERFSPYFVVLDVDHINGLYIICDERVNLDDRNWTFDTEESKQVTFDYFKRVKYDRIEGFVADVVPGHIGFLKDWTHYGSPFIPIQPILPIEPESFNFCIGHYVKGSDGAIELYDKRRDVHYGTMADAGRFLSYVTTNGNSNNSYKIFRLEEV